MRLRKRMLSAMLALAMAATTVAIPDVQASEMKEDVNVKQTLETYNTVWNSPSKDSSGSMPIGNGDITANVWVGPEKDLCFYIGKSDAWSEATRLLKLGKIRVTMDPNPFESVEFTQILHLNEGEVEIVAGPEGQQVRLHIWVDANNPVIRVEAEGDYDFKMNVTTEIWRDHEVTMDEEKSSASFSFNGVRSVPGGPPKESADVLQTEEDRVIWYHRNQWSYFDKILKQQHMETYETKDPYQDLTFGTCLKSDVLTEIDGASIQSAESGKDFEFSVYPYTAQTDTVEEWEAGLDAQIEKVELQDLETAKEKHQQWWKDFWNRSYIFISGDDAAQTVTKGYLTQRYMQAIQGRGAYPIKFNGGTITFDYNGYGPDYRQWGPAYWFQNTRHFYWNMLASGDFEMMQPFFEMYLNALDMQKAQTKKFYNHDGAFFPETMNFTGLYIGDDFGQPTWENDTVEPENEYVKYYWQGGLELSAMMLEYYRYTKDEQFAASTLLPLATEVVKFYDNHYERVNGKLVINPSHVLETYHSGVTNPVEVIAGLDRVLTLLLELPENLITSELRSEWESLYHALPELPIGTDGNGDYVKPAEKYDTVTSNSENPELYPVFPYKLYDIGKENLDTAVNTYNRRINRATGCWTQDAIDAAYLGLETEAKKAVTDHFSRIPGDVRFSGYWSKGNDWMPDLDNGGSGMMALQAMLMQCDNGEIQVLPAWPSEWNVDAKLYAEDNTVVKIKYHTGETPVVETNPQSRQEDVTVYVPEVPEPPSEDPIA